MKIYVALQDQANCWENSNSLSSLSTPLEAFRSDESGQEEKEILFLKTIKRLKEGHSKKSVKTDFTDMPKHSHHTVSSHNKANVHL